MLYLCTNVRPVYKMYTLKRKYSQQVIDNDFKKLFLLLYLYTVMVKVCIQR